MRHALLPSLAIVFAFASISVAADVESGLQVGDRAGAFQVKDVTGKYSGKSLCYR